MTVTEEEQRQGTPADRRTSNFSTGGTRASFTPTKAAPGGKVSLEDSAKTLKTVPCSPTEESTSSSSPLSAGLPPAPLEEQEPESPVKNLVEKFNRSVTESEMTTTVCEMDRTEHISSFSQEDPVPVREANGPSRGSRLLDKQKPWLRDSARKLDYRSSPTKMDGSGPRSCSSDLVNDASALGVLPTISLDENASESPDKKEEESTAIASSDDAESLDALGGEEEEHIVGSWSSSSSESESGEESEEAKTSSESEGGWETGESESEVDTSKENSEAELTDASKDEELSEAEDELDAFCDEAVAVSSSLRSLNKAVQELASEDVPDISNETPVFEEVQPSSSFDSAVEELTKHTASTNNADSPERMAEIVKDEAKGEPPVPVHEATGDADPLLGSLEKESPIKNAALLKSESEGYPAAFSRSKSLASAATPTQESMFSRSVQSFSVAETTKDRRKLKKKSSRTKKKKTSLSRTSFSRNLYGGVMYQDKTESVAVLSMVESKRQFWFQHEAEACQSEYEHYIKVMKDSLHELDRVEKLVVSSYEAFGGYLFAIDAICNDVFVDNKGKMLSDSQRVKREKELKDKPTVNNTSALLKPVFIAYSSLKEELEIHVPPMELDVKEVSMLKEEVSTNAEALESRGNGLKKGSLEKAEATIQESFDALMAAAGSCEDGEPSPSTDRWLLESSYRNAANLGLLTWMAIRRDFQKLYEDILELDEEWRVRLKQILLSFLPRRRKVMSSAVVTLMPGAVTLQEANRSSEAEKDAIERTLEEITRSRVGAVELPAVPPRDEYNFVLGSDFCKSIFVRERRTLEVKMGRQWKVALGVVTRDSYLHVFVTDWSKEEADAIDKSSLSAIDLEGSKSLRTGNPDASVLLTECDVKVEPGSSVIEFVPEIKSGRTNFFRKSRDITVRLTTSDMAANWVRELWNLVVKQETAYDPVPMFLESKFEEEATGSLDMPTLQSSSTDSSEIGAIDGQLISF